MRSSIDPFEGLGEKVHGPEFQYLKNTRRGIRNLDGKGETESERERGGGGRDGKKKGEQVRETFRLRYI